jgi:hypothetical protein
MNHRSIRDKSPRRLGIALAVVFWVTLAAPAQSSRIVAIGDVHGSIDGLVTILRSAELIDDENRWVGGTDTLVQTGDLTDRGEHVRAVLDLMMSLEEQASAAGGRVVALLGNHEVNNLVSFFSPDSTPPEAFAAVLSHFADDRSQDRLKDAYGEWRVWRKRYPQCATSKSRRVWMDEHPPGYLEYIAALGPDGRYGRWLRGHNVAALIDGTVFVHGGLSAEPPEEFPTETLESINRQIKLEVERFDADKVTLVESGVILPFSNLAEMFCAVRGELSVLAAGNRPSDTERLEQMQAIYDRFPLPATWLAFHEQGPLWFRGFAYWTDEEGPAALARVIAQYGAERFVVGHTPQPKGIHARFDDHVFLIDTGMVFGAAAGGRPSALELVDERVLAIYAGTRTAFRPLTDESGGGADAGGGAAGFTVWIGPDDEPLPFSNSEEVVDFLLHASIESVEDIPIGITKPKKLTLAQGALRSNAAFRHVDITELTHRLPNGQTVMHFRDNHVNEVAAYELSRLLGVNNVPPAVPRKVQGREGSVQMWVQNATMETQRRERKIEPPDRLHFDRQFHDMRIFDNLINNVDRNSGNILLDPSWKMWWIDHTRSFARSRELPDPKRVIECSRPLFEALKSLDEEEVTERLRPYLPMAEIDALHERRRRLIELIEQRIAEKGEAHVLFNYGDPDPRVKITYEDSSVPDPEGN